MKYWIIMADVIDSHVENQLELQSQLADIVQFINNKFAKNILSPLTITLGDEFQGVCKNLANLTEIIIEINELKFSNKYSFELRFVVYYGEIETPINEKIAHGMLGKGLTEARKALNELKKDESNYFFKTEKESKSIVLKDAFIVLDGISKKWNINNDFDVVQALLNNPDYKVAAIALNKDRTLIWKRAKSLQVLNYNSQKRVIKYLSK
jgi:hypothetical protein